MKVLNHLILAARFQFFVVLKHATNGTTVPKGQIIQASSSGESMGMGGLDECVAWCKY